jgi:hypothetical protein
VIVSTQLFTSPVLTITVTLIVPARANWREPYG